MLGRDISGGYRQLMQCGQVVPLDLGRDVQAGIDGEAVLGPPTLALEQQRLGLQPGIHAALTIFSAFAVPLLIANSTVSLMSASSCSSVSAANSPGFPCSLLSTNMPISLPGNSGERVAAPASN